MQQQLQLLLHVREHIPLEQGLRPSESNESFSFNIVREHIPLEQGLRRIYVL